MASANTLPRILYVHVAVKNSEVVNARSIAAQFGGSVRSAYRTVAYLRDQLGAPLAYDGQRNSYYYTDPDFELPTIPLSHAEAAAILRVYRTMLGHLPLPLSGELATAIAKLQDFLPQSLSASLFAAISVRPDPLRQVSVERLEQLREALEARCTVRLRYFTASRNEVLERRLDPYHLTFRRGDWYVVGHCHLRQRVQTFAVSRIRKLQMTDEPFTPAADFDASRYFKNAFGIDNTGETRHIVVEFDLPASRYVGERAWHASQRLETLAEGRLRVHFDLALNYEVRQWVLSYGSHARVVEPPRLVAEIAAEHERAARQYNVEGGGLRGEKFQ